MLEAKNWYQRIANGWNSSNNGVWGGHTKLKIQFWARGGDFGRFSDRDPSFPLKYEKWNSFLVFPCKNMFIWAKKIMGTDYLEGKMFFQNFNFWRFSLFLPIFGVFFGFFCLKTSSKLQIKLPGVYCNTGSHFYTSTESFFNLESTKINVFLVFFGIFRVFKRFFPFKCWNLLRYLLRVTNNAVFVLFLT